MALPQPAQALPRQIRHASLALTTKPSAAIEYTIALGNSTQQTPTHLVIFVNGLVAPKASWLAVMAGLIRKRQPGSFPSMLAYDRYGQGLSEDRDPLDEAGEKGYGHDVMDVVRDLHQLISQIATQELGKVGVELRLVLVANSIGCAIARLYAWRYPGTVAGLLLLDSMVANSDLDFWPNPDEEGFKAELLPEDVTVEVLREHRAKFAAIFRPEVVNREGLDRRRLPKLLPRSDEPKLMGPDGKRPFVTVVGHDFERFADEGLQQMGTPRSLHLKFTNPIWHEYNEGLAKLTDPERSRGPVLANGCGHFVQRDDPDFVVEELCVILDRLGDEAS